MICNLFIWSITFNFLILLSSNLEREFLEWKPYLTNFLKVNLSYELQQVKKKMVREIPEEGGKNTVETQCYLFTVELFQKGFKVDMDI